MWQVDFYTALERERERLRELEQRRRLVDAAQADGPSMAVSSWLRGAARLRSLGRRVFSSVVGAFDRPAVGPHHL